VQQTSRIEEILSFGDRDVGAVRRRTRRRAGHDGNAGSADVVGPLWEADPDAWWDEVAVHLRGAMLLTHACLPSMLARTGGRLVLLYGNWVIATSRGAVPTRQARPVCSGSPVSLASAERCSW